MKKIINLFTLGVFLTSNIMTPLTNFIYAEETETLEEGGDLSVVRDMGDAEDSNENIPETSPEETVDNSTGEESLPAVEPEIQPEEQTDDSPEDLPESTESHNSAVTPVEDEEENKDASTIQEEKSVDEEKEIMGDCPSGQQYNEELNICYTKIMKNNVPVYYGTDMDTSHKYNNNPIGTITVFVSVGTEQVPITMMDMNLGATSKDINNEDSHGELYQRGNNAPIKTATGVGYTREKYKNYRPGHPYNDARFKYGNYDYWEYNDNTNYNNLRGGSGDIKDSTNVHTFLGGIKNGRNRQGPCPEGYHVPSAQEWNVLISYWGNGQNLSENQLDYTVLNSLIKDNLDENDFQKTFYLPSVTPRVYYNGDFVLYAGQYNYRTSSPMDINVFGTTYEAYNFLFTKGGSELSLTIMTYKNYNRGNGYPLRCFKDSSDIEVHTVTFHDDSGRVLGIENGELKQLLEDGQKAQEPILEDDGISAKFLGWRKDLNNDDYFDFSTTVEDDTNLYAKWYVYEEYPITYENTLQVENNNPINYYERSPNISLVNLYKDENTKFEGWYTDEEYQNKVKGVAIPQGSTGARTFYAKWSCKAGSVREGDKCVFPGKVATLIHGTGFNQALKTLATGSTVTDQTTPDTLIKGFVWSDNMPEEGVTKIKISIDENSNVPVWAWFDTAGYQDGQGIIYYTSEADKIYMNSNSSYMFNSMQGLTLLDLSNFDTSLVTTIEAMFTNCTNLISLNLDNWDLSKLTNYGGMYGGTTSLKTLSLKHWILPSYISMLVSNRAPGLSAELDRVDVTGWDLSNTTNASCLFAYNKTKEIRGLNTWKNMENINNMYEMFYGCSNLTSLDLSNFDTSSVTDMSLMFYGCSNLTSLDLSNFDTSNVTTTSVMFYDCTNLTGLNLDNWDLSKLNNYGSMFGNTTSLKTLSVKNWIAPSDVQQLLSRYKAGLSAQLDRIDVSGWNLRNTTSLYYLFGDNHTKEIIGLNTWDTSNITDMSQMFYQCDNIQTLDISNFDTSNVTNMSVMFNGCSNLKSLDLSNFDTSNVTNMSVMFNGCSNLTGLNLDNWVINSTNIGGMFAGATSLEKVSMRNWTIPETFTNAVGCRTSNLCAELDELDVSGWNLSKTTNLNGLFGDSKAKEIIGLDTWDTSNVQNMNNMFNGCSNLTGLNLDNWDLSKSPDMTNIFSGSSNLKELSLKNWKIPTSFRNILGGNDRNHFSAEPNRIDVTNWDLSETEDLSGLFGDNKTREIRGLGTWDTSNVKDMSEMFAGTPRLTALDLSNWDTSNVENMTYMFVASSALKTIYASEKFVTTKATDVINSMFAYTALVGGQGTVYDWNHAGTDYAKIDGGPHNPGYFTQANSIRYDLDGGELQHPKTAYAPIGSFTLSEPTKEGYTFIGWTGSNGDVPQREVTIQQGTIGDLEFTANWEINKHQIIFDTDGGETLNPLEVEYNSVLSGFQLPIPIRESYRFLGWEGLPNIMPDEDITIKALWERVNNEPQYSGGGGGGSSSAIDVAEKTIDNNKHNAADERGNDESRTPDGKQGDTDSSVEDNYSPEFIEAYNFAKTNGITTQSNIQKAKMNSPLTRIAMAKMLSYYAINVLGQEPDMSKTINFDDVSAKRDAEYDNGVTLAYQLGIMGQNMKNNKFRPNDEVTRAEFVTALSRMIYGMKDGTGKQKYYEPHMARLYNEGVINKTDPKMKEKRGYVMIMLMRTIK